MLRIFDYISWRISFDKRMQKSKIQKEQKYKRIKEKRQNGYDICLLGDSLIEFCNIKMISGKKCFNAGVGDATTEDVLKYLNNHLLTGFFKVFVLILGTNDVKYKYEPQKTVENLLRIFSFISKHYSDAKIIYYQLPPVNGRWDRKNSEIEIINSKLLSLSSSSVEFLNFNYLKDRKGNLDKQYTYDGLHFNVQAYELVEKDLMRSI